MYRRLSMTLPFLSALLGLYSLLVAESATLQTRRILLVLMIGLATASMSLAYRRPDHFRRAPPDDGLDAELSALADEEVKAEKRLAATKSDGVDRVEAQSRLSAIVARRLKLEALREERAERAAAVTRKVLACQDAIEADPRSFPSAVQVSKPVDGFDRIEAATGMPQVHVAAGRQESAVYGFPA